MSHLGLIKLVFFPLLYYIYKYSGLWLRVNTVQGELLCITNTAAEREKWSVLVGLAARTLCGRWEIFWYTRCFLYRYILKIRSSFVKFIIYVHTIRFSLCGWDDLLMIMWTHTLFTIYNFMRMIFLSYINFKFVYYFIKLNLKKFFSLYTIPIPNV